MRVLNVVLITLALCSISIVSLSCTSKSESAAQNQVVSVQRGNLAVDITASGNLAFSHEEDLAFEMAGYVAEIIVQEGDSVKQGQVLATLDTSQWETNMMSLQSGVLQAQINLDNAEITLEEAEGLTTSSITGDSVRVITDPYEIKILKLQVELAKLKLAAAQKALDDALNTSPEVTASFDGFIAKVNVSGGDEVYKGRVAVQLADPNKFEADILVSEMDIFQVKVGGAATMQADAFPTLSLPAKVTHISPTATIQSGVVNYKVKVEVQPLEAVTQEGQTSLGGQGPTMIPEDFQLREGLTVTVNIHVEQKTDVLLVPNGAVTTKVGKTYVQVMSPEGVIEEREITTGISNWQYTEVTEGLDEGEKVVVSQGTTTTSSTTQQQGGSMPIFGPSR